MDPRLGFRKILILRRLSVAFVAPKPNSTNFISCILFELILSNVMYQVKIDKIFVECKCTDLLFVNVAAW